MGFSKMCFLADIGPISDINIEMGTALLWNILCVVDTEDK